MTHITVLHRVVLITHPSDNDEAIHGARVQQTALHGVPDEILTGDGRVLAAYELLGLVGVVLVTFVERHLRFRKAGGAYNSMYHGGHSQ